ncbi:MAG: DUF1330 domain-containing protein [Bacteroidota bacterium]
MKEKYLNPTKATARNLILRKISGSFLMLNLLRFREWADYSETPNIAPLVAISGKEAYQLYIKHTLPHLQKSGGEIVFYGKGGAFFVGPENEEWDEVLLVKQNSIGDFMSFASNKECLIGSGHRTAALEDFRLLPLLEKSFINERLILKDRIA